MAEHLRFQEGIMPTIITVTLFHFCDEECKYRLCLLNLSDINLKSNTITIFAIDDTCNSSYSIRMFMLDPMVYWL